MITGLEIFFLLKFPMINSFKMASEFFKNLYREIEEEFLLSAAAAPPPTSHMHNNGNIY